MRIAQIKREVSSGGGFSDTYCVGFHVARTWHSFRGTLSYCRSIVQRYGLRPTVNMQGE